MKSLSRREALRASAAALALAPIPAVALAALPAPTIAAKPKDDAKLLALIASVPALLDESDKAEERSHETREKVDAEFGLPFPAYWDIQKEFAARGVTLTKAQACRVRDDRFRVVSAKYGHHEAYDRWDKTAGRVRRLLTRIYATRAHTLSGITAKQRLAIELGERLDDLETYRPEMWTASVLRDLEQFAGRA